MRIFFWKNAVKSPQGRGISLRISVVSGGCPVFLLPLTNTIAFLSAFQALNIFHYVEK